MDVFPIIENDDDDGKKRVSFITDDDDVRQLALPRAKQRGEEGREKN